MEENACGGVKENLHTDHTILTFGYLTAVNKFSLIAIYAHLLSEHFVQRLINILFRMLSIRYVESLRR